MHRRRALIAAAWLFALAACGEGGEGRGGVAERRVDPRCDGRELPPIGPGGIGPAQLGVRLSTLRSLCRVEDTSFVIAEGMVERGHAVYFGDHRVLTVSSGTRDTSIVRLIVHDSSFRTPQGVGVGSTIGDVRRYYPVLSYSTGERRVMSIPSLPGISFAYEGRSLPEDPSRATAREPSVMDDARVTSLWIFRPVSP